MADLTLICPNCGATTVVSEFVEPDLIACRSCKQKLEKPASTYVKQKPTVRRQASPDTPSEPRKTVEPPNDTVMKCLRRNKSTPSPSVGGDVGIKHIVGGWALFLLVGLVMAVLRYGGVSKSVVGLSKEWGYVLTIGFYVLILIHAFKDSTYQGLACLIPPYALYYLFTGCDDFYLRALVAGILVGVGQDSIVVFRDVIVSGIDSVNAWIMSGG